MIDIRLISQEPYYLKPIQILGIMRESLIETGFWIIAQTVSLPRIDFLTCGWRWVVSNSPIYTFKG